MIQDNTVLGMSITRGFGGGRWKYSNEIQNMMKDNYSAKSPRPGSLTPPYLTAKPVVSLTEVQPGRDFMILATDKPVGPHDKRAGSDAGRQMA